MEEMDIRWQQRFDNYKKALAKLAQGVEILNDDYDLDLNDLIREGVIQRFEYTHELAWNVMKDYAAYQGNTEIRGSRDAIRYALAQGLITDKVWMETINARNLSSHDYNQETADMLISNICNCYFLLFKDFETKMEGLICTD